jgi:hypothetical protein
LNAMKRELMIEIRQSAIETLQKADRSQIESLTYLLETQQELMQKLESKGQEL